MPTSSISPQAVATDATEYRDAHTRNRSITEFIANAKLLHILPTDTPEHRSVATRIRTLKPALEATGLFDVLQPCDPAVATLLSG